MTTEHLPYRVVDHLVTSWAELEWDEDKVQATLDKYVCPACRRRMWESAQTALPTMRLYYSLYRDDVDCVSRG
jgi:hypothetical protein